MATMWAPCPRGSRCWPGARTRPLRRWAGHGVIGIQFHPEVVHTPLGVDILRNFLTEVCGCSLNWTPDSFIDASIREIREKVGEKRVLLGLSGGVDSSVAAALIHRAIGDQLTPVFVENGLLRLGEAEMVREVFARNFGMQLVFAEAADGFLGRLAGMTDPEEKRKVIGDEFVRVFEREAATHGPFEILAQGTLYPDVIESTTADTKAAAKIKTHHNVGGLPKDLRFELLEPLKFLFKDEVRKVGEALGLPDEIVWRQPFPGPGPGGAAAGRGDRRRPRFASAGRCHRAGGDRSGWIGPGDLAVLCGAAPRAFDRGDGGLPHLRQNLRDPGDHQPGRNDRRLGPHPLRRAGPDEQPDRQRSPRHQPGGLRHLLETAGDD